jgi:hypothetical protein
MHDWLLRGEAGHVADAASALPSGAPEPPESPVAPGAASLTLASSSWMLTSAFASVLDSEASLEPHTSGARSLDASPSTSTFPPCESLVPSASEPSTVPASGVFVEEVDEQDATSQQTPPAATEPATRITLEYSASAARCPAGYPHPGTWTSRTS